MIYDLDTEMRSMTGRYASYWNAFLLCDYCGVFTLPDTEAETRDRPKLPSGSVYY